MMLEDVLRAEFNAYLRDPYRRSTIHPAAQVSAPSSSPAALLVVGALAAGAVAIFVATVSLDHSATRRSRRIL